MEERRRVQLGLEIVGRQECEPDVADVERGRCTVEGDVRQAQWRQHDCRRGDCDEDGERGRGQQPAGTAGVERRQRDRARLADLADDQPGDEEARQDEEDVDADEAAGQQRKPRVIAEDEQDGYGAESLDVGAERGTPGTVFDRREAAHGG